MIQRQDLAGYGYARFFATRWNDNDVFGHLNNTIYYAAMDTTITSWLLGVGALRIEPSTNDATMPKPEGEMAVVASSSCTFLQSVSFPEGLVVGLRAGRLGTSSVTWELGIHRESDRELVATGEFVHVFIGSESKRPAPIPADVRAEIELQLLVTV